MILLCVCVLALLAFPYALMLAGMLLGGPVPQRELSAEEQHNLDVEHGRAAYHDQIRGGK